MGADKVGSRTVTSALVVVRFLSSAIARSPYPRAAKKLKSQPNSNPTYQP